MDPIQFAERLKREADELSRARQLRKARAYRAAARKALEWTRQPDNKNAPDRLFGLDTSED